MVSLNPATREALSTAWSRETLQRTQQAKRKSYFTFLIHARRKPFSALRFEFYAFAKMQVSYFSKGLQGPLSLLFEVKSGLGL